MIVYELYLYIIVSYTREILMCCIPTVREQVEEHFISYKVEYRMVIYRINFYLPHYEFKIGLYVNFEKWWDAA